MLANGKVPVALGPFHIGTKPTVGSCGSSEWFESLLIAHVVCELLGDPKVVLLDLKDGVSMKSQSGMVFHCPQFVLPKITLRTRLTIKANVSFALEPQWWANKSTKGSH